MSIRIVFAMSMAVTTVAALVFTQRLVSRPVSFEVSAQTEVVAGVVSALADGQQIGFEFKGAVLCHGFDAHRISAAECPGARVAHGGGDGTLVFGDQATVTITRIARGNLSVLVAAPSEAPSADECPQGIAAFHTGATRVPLCSPVRLTVPGDSKHMPRFTLRGMRARIGQAFGDLTAPTTPALVQGKLVVESSSLLRDLALAVYERDLNPHALSIELATHTLKLGDEEVGACADLVLCGADAAPEAPFTAGVVVDSAGGLRTNVSIIAPAVVVDRYGSSGDILRPLWFARIVEDPYIGFLYALAGLLLAVVLKVDRWIWHEAEPSCRYPRGSSSAP